MTKENITFFVESLNLAVWLFFVWPRLIQVRFFSKSKVNVCYVVDSSRVGWNVAKLSSWITGLDVQRLEFRMVEVRDKTGLQVRLRTAYKDRMEISQRIIQDPRFQHITKPLNHRSSLPLFLANEIPGKFDDPNSLWRALYFVQVAVWKSQQSPSEAGNPTVFLRKRAWQSIIDTYATEYGVCSVWVPAPRDLQYLLRQYLPFVVSKFRYWRTRLLATKPLKSPYRTMEHSYSDNENSATASEYPADIKLVIECLGPLNLTRPERLSEVFFWQNSSLQGKDLLITFLHPSFPLDQETYQSLEDHQMDAFALSPWSTTVPEARLFLHKPNKQQDYTLPMRYVGNTVEDKWFKENTTRYITLRSYWTELLRSCNARVYLASNKYDSTPSAILDAMHDVGGVTALYQVSYESNPVVWAPVSADISFIYSDAAIDVQRYCGSEIQYNIITGYLGDHRFNLLRGEAQGVRNNLHKAGAEFILAYFDDNSGKDARWGFDHPWSRENYEFLLTKVLEQPWLGLVIKPKGPSDLRIRLGPVLELLERAEATGRCYVYEGNAARRAHPPAEAALVADVAIHGHLYTGSAGIDAALAGTPTLLLDREGWHVSPLYQLGLGKVVFQDWDSLWCALREHYQTKSSLPGFGDWSPILDEIDPFRDGKAAKRMGNFLKQLIDGMRHGLDRDNSLADAVETYRRRWGDNTIIEMAENKLADGSKLTNRISALLVPSDNRI